jgi:DNA polymerase-3 subunit epsilon
VTSNIELPTFTSGKHSLAFLPDHVLVRSASKWSELDYSDLRVAYHPQRFIESGEVPRDSERVGTTWQYVNKNGGPDRRFNNNRQLPVMLYGEVELTTPTGLRWMLQLSRPDIASVMASALRAHPTQRTVEL